MFSDQLARIDLTDLIRGDGEWRNMQEIIRRTFRVSLESQQRANEKISQLSNQVVNLVEELARKPSWEDVERLVESKLLAQQRKPGFSNSREIEELRTEVTHVKANLETKVNMRTVDTLLSKKVDRTDIAMRNLGDLTASSNAKELKALSEGMMDLQSRLHVIETETHKWTSEHDLSAQKRDVLVMRSQIDNLFRNMNDFYPKDHVKHLLDQKVNQVDLPKLLGAKAEAQEVHNVLATLETALERHEKQLTSLRLSTHDPTVFRDDPIVRTKSRHNVSHNNGHSKHKDRGNSSFQDSRLESSAVLGFLPSRREFDEQLRDGRIETMLAKIYSQTCNLSIQHDDVLKHLDQLDAAHDQLTRQQALTANKEGVELLAVVVEEQRLRTDSIIQGSVKIKPIHKDMRRLEAEMQALQSYLVLPQQRTLPEVIDKLSAQILSLKDEIQGISGAMQEQCVSGLHGLKSRVDLIETIWQAYEVDRDRLQYLLDVVDFADTPYANMKELSQSIMKVYFLLQGDPLLNQLKESDKASKDVIAMSNASVFNRINDLEDESRRLTQALASCQHALLAIKSLIATDGPKGSSPAASPVLPPPKSRKPSVNFDAAVDQLMSSLDDVEVPIQQVDLDASGGGQPVWSLSGIDERLAQLQQNRAELRRKMAAEIRV